MKIYTTLLVYAASPDGPQVLTNSSDEPPCWVLPDSDRESVDIVRDGFYNITGIDKNWHPFYKQTCTYELFWNNHKEVYIAYSTYLPAICSLVDLSYRWTTINGLSKESKLYNIIRYIYSGRL